MNPSVVTRKIKLLRLGQTAAFVVVVIAVKNSAATRRIVGCRVGRFTAKGALKNF
jgi:hypothetical protein